MTVKMGNKHSGKTTMSADQLEVKTVMGSCGLGHCASSCCEDETVAQVAPAERKMKEIEAVLRYGHDSSDQELLRMIRMIVTPA